jgi:hypothetical protein
LGRRQVLIQAADVLRGKLPAGLKDYDYRLFGSWLKVFYGEPRVHFELWFYGHDARYEIGLHFEADQQTNRMLLDYFDSRLVEVKDELGPEIELEQWTKTWSRLYEVHPVISDDAILLERATDRMAEVIRVLQPLLKEWEAKFNCAGR